MNKVVTLKIDTQKADTKSINSANSQINECIKKHNKLGYKVISITPLTSGNYDYDNMTEFSYGYGYSFTSGIIIVFEKF